MGGAVPKKRGAGYTLVEVVIAVTISSLALLNFHLLSKAGATAAKSGVLKMSVNEELDLTVDRISLALMGSSEDDLVGPPRAPANSTFVEYAIILGQDDGEPIFGPTESIQWELGGDSKGVLQWRQSAAHGESTDDGEEEEASQGDDRVLVWSRSIPTAFRGETLDNDEDDNGNGLLNEHGLAFTREGPAVDIHLTVERLGEGGAPVSLHKTHRITCRN